MNRSSGKRAFFTALIVLAAFALPAGCGGDNETAAPRMTTHGSGNNYTGFCTQCHGLGPGMVEYPPDHTGRTNDICLTCHRG